MGNMRVEANIDLNSFVYNMESMHNNLSDGTKMMAVIKTDGYGHGALEIAKKINGLPYLFGYAVATVEEAIALREGGIDKPILILGFTFPESYKDIVKYDLRPAVFKYDMAKALSDEAVLQNKTVNFHIKIDSGMGRIGFIPSSDSTNVIQEISALPNVKMEGIFTHFAKADMTDHSPTELQYKKFTGIIEELSSIGVTFDIRHCCNSAGIIRFPHMQLDMVRAGITLYGLWPSDETERDIISLNSAMTLKSHIAYIKTVEEGTAISYGGTYVAKDKRRIATIPVGYGDGYPRALSNKGYVLIHGEKAPICGRVCMDQFMVDVTDIEGVAELDEVVLIGRQGNEEISMEFLGDISGRFNYELACDIGKRVPRTYLDALAE